jgi:hypothetical protein
MPDPTIHSPTINYQLPAVPRIIVIQLSLRAFVCGIIGLLPVIGLVPALHALACWVRVRRRYRDEWNPAASYLRCGSILAVAGLGVTAVGIPAAILWLAIYRLQSGQ